MYAERIKEIRSKFNLSVAKLSQKINIPERTIVSYEKEGRTPSLEFLTQLCVTLNINPSWFLFGKGDMLEIPLENQQLKDLVAELVDQRMKQKGIID